MTILETPTPNLNDSLAFYESLGFTKLKDSQTLLTDSKVIVSINDDRFARAGIKIYKEKWDTEINKIKAITKVFSKENNHVFYDATGVPITLVESEEEQPNIENAAASVLGTFAGVSLETPDFEKSFKLLGIIGFEPSMGGLEQGWVALTNKAGFSISLMQPNTCPHLFFNPSMTYFNGKNNIEVIANVRKANVKITEEITTFNKEGIVDNIILRDPGGYGFFIFSD
ncbi:MAG: hypothetical protein HKO66_13515 [Saprospiraceae bacterium]|nr:hypothetical protein [Bacteroidia bacterium]NNL93253.1 hypothetical protein [Saprospiraceae bacterium]